jgi:opacity protein-like surface antigen
MRSLVLLAALLLFIAPDLSAEMVINTVTLSGSDEKTYFILESNQKKPLKIKTEDTQGIKIELPENVSWRAPLSNASAQGLVEGYRMESGDIVVDFTSEAHVKEVIYRQHKGIVETILIIVPGPAEQNMKQTDLTISADAPPQAEQEEPKLPSKFVQKRTIPQTVKRVDLDYDDQTIKIAITLSQPERLKVVENERTHQFSIQLPKVNWQTVDIDPELEQIASSYFVDQSHPKWTTLVISMDRDLTILKREVINNPGQNPLFVLYLGQNTGMNSIRTASNDPSAIHLGADLKEKAEKEDPLEQHMHYANSEKTIIQKNPFSFQTEKPLYLKKTARYKKGTTNYTDISRGPYMAITSGFASGQSGLVMSSPNTTTAQQPGLNGFNYGFIVGYGENIDKFYAGLELFFDMNRQSGTSSGTDAALGAFKTTTALKYSYGAALRLGMYAGPESMVYMRLGGIGSKFRHKSTDTAGGRMAFAGSATQGMSGFLYGFGMETALDNHFSVRMDYDRLTYQSFSKNLTNQLGAVSGKFSPRMDRYTLALSYKFNDSVGPNSPTGVYQIPAGFYLGTGLDMSNTSLNHSITAPTLSWGMKSTTLTPMWMMHMGYGIQHGRYYYGMELSTTLGTKYIKETLNDQVNNAIQTANSRFQPTAGLFLRGGYTFGHGNMVYLKSGMILSSFHRESQVQGTARLAGNVQGKKTLTGVGIGGGLETFVSQNVSIRNEVMHEIYKKFKLHSAGVQEHFSPSLTRYQLSMNYTF